MGKPNPDDAARSNRILGIILTVTLAVSMVPVALLPAFADEPVERPAVTGGDAALEGYSAESVPVAIQREDGMYVADGLVYAVTDGGLSLVGFDGLPEGGDAPKEIVVPEAVSADGEDMPVVAVVIAEGQVAGSAVGLTLPQSVNDVNTATLAAVFPNLAAIEIAAPKSSAPVAAGAAAMRAAYSSFGGVLYRNVWVATDGNASQTTLTKELVWAPPATVAARIPVECTSIVPGAFAGAKDLKTVVCFGVMEDIPQTQKAEDGTVTPGAFTDEQIQTVNVIVPQTGTVVPDGDHVSANVAITDDSTMDIKRECWWKSGFASDKITLGEVCGSTTKALPVTEEGTLGVAEAEVAYAPETTQNSSSRKAGIEPPESAIPTPVPDDDQIDPSESGLVFTHLADMTLSVSWKGDPTATPAHLDIPAYVTIDGVAYPVTEIADGAFEGAVFLESVAIPEGVTTIGDNAFEGCTNLADAALPGTFEAAPDASADRASSNWGEEPTPVPAQGRTDDYSWSDGTGYVISEDDAGLSPYAIHEPSDYLYILQVPTGANIDDIFFRSPYFVNVDLISSNATYFRYGISFRADLKLGIKEVPADRDSKYLDNTSVGQCVLFTGANSAVYEEITNSVTMALYFRCTSLYRITSIGFEADSAGTRLEYPNGDACTFYPHGTTMTVYPKTEINLGVDGDTLATQSWVDENYLTKAATELDNFYDKAAFNTISYAGLEDASWTGALPTFYVDDASKRPTVPEPRREGHEFQGWTWDGQASPAKDPTAAFSGGGAVTLTAVWEEAEPETPEATHFFTGERPLRFDDASDRQTHVIKVRLSNAQKTLASVSFEGDDRTGLLKDTSGVELYVGATEDALASGTRIPWGGSTGSGWTCALAKLSDDSYGVYVGISVPTAAIDEASVPVSYTDGSYVASLVKMNYAFA